ncbi:hypothetical protein R3I94_018196 [Phoxinus phoxinus]
MCDGRSLTGGGCSRSRTHTHTVRLTRSEHTRATIIQPFKSISDISDVDGRVDKVYFQSFSIQHHGLPLLATKTLK